MPPALAEGKRIVLPVKRQGSAGTLTLPQSDRSLRPMTKQPPKSPGQSEPGRQTREERDARLARALRDNLRKRKAQTRERAAREGRADEPKGGKA